MVSPVPVSVVIPCYRSATTIRRALLSVVNQTLRPLEVILVDDGSGDDTLEVLRGLRDEFSANWIRVLELGVNQGAATARNAGWDMARGDYIAFLDSDDAWLPEKIDCQWNFMRTHVHYALTGHLATRNAAVPRQDPAREPHWVAISRSQILWRNPIVTPSIMVLRRLPLRLDPSRRYIDDHHLLQQMVFAGFEIALIKKPLVIVYKALYGEGGLSGDLWNMERADLRNYVELRRRRQIGHVTLYALLSLSLLKFCRRLAMVGARRTWRKLVQNGFSGRKRSESR